MTYPIKSIGLLWDAKSVTASSNFVQGINMTGNSVFGTNPANAIYIGTSDRVDVVLPDGRTILTFNNMVAGVWIAMPPFIHLNTGTAATGIIVGITAG